LNSKLKTLVEALTDEIQSAKGLKDYTPPKVEWWKSIDWKDEEFTPIFDKLDEKTRQLIIDEGLCPTCDEEEEKEEESSEEEEEVEDESSEEKEEEEEEEMEEDLPYEDGEAVDFKLTPVDSVPEPVVKAKPDPHKVLERFDRITRNK
jgi:hypothetical protein